MRPLRNRRRPSPNNLAGTLAAARDESSALHVKLSKERRIYLGILGLGLAAVAIDRAFLNAGPGQASASVSPLDPALPPPTVEAPKSSSLVSVARRLDDFKLSPNSGHQSDAFVVPAAWQPAPPKPAEAAPQAAKGPQMPENRVTGLIGRGEAVAAVVNGNALRIGERSKEGVKLVRVVGNKVTLEEHGVETTIIFDPSQK